MVILSFYRFIIIYYDIIIYIKIRKLISGMLGHFVMSAYDSYNQGEQKSKFIHANSEVQV